MKTLARFAFSMGIAAALLAGCGGSQPPVGAPGAMPQIAASKKTFHYTGHKQTFVVPGGVNQLNVTVLGASGGSTENSYGSLGGNGGRVKATIPVTPGEKLAIFVGGMGARIAGGFNGGEPGGIGNASGSGVVDGNGGGGASDIRVGGDQLSDRIIIAGGGGGGGGEGDYGQGNGGNGGGKIGAAGLYGGYKSDGYGGTGGTQSAGGDGGEGGHLRGYGRGSAGHPGALGLGGNGGGKSSDGGGGGGGGGGYYGGGGAGAGSHAASGIGGGGGGGGGSSFFEPSATHVKSLQGKAPAGNGQITIFW
jgi:large repetitive protein